MATSLDFVAHRAHSTLMIMRRPGCALRWHCSCRACLLACRRLARCGLHVAPEQQPLCIHSAEPAQPCFSGARRALVRSFAPPPHPPHSLASLIASLIASLMIPWWALSRSVNQSVLLEDLIILARHRDQLERKVEDRVARDPWLARARLPPLGAEA